MSHLACPSQCLHEDCTFVPALTAEAIANWRDYAASLPLSSILEGTRPMLTGDPVQRLSITIIREQLQALARALGDGVVAEAAGEFLIGVETEHAIADE